jgi:hypothetical protein
MSSNNLLKPAGLTTVRDYRHAARIFTDDNFRLSPKYGFLFYVEFDFNPLITNIAPGIAGIGNGGARELGMLVKSATLPKFTIDTKVHNAYNRKNIVQNKINYDPVNIVFHDDQADNVRSFWYDYYSYFYRDPDYADATYNAAHKYQSRATFDWGYTPRPAIGYNTSNAMQPYQYIQAIRIYSLYQGYFSEYELINPIITSFKHGDHVNGENTLLTHEMSVQFETVKYLTGSVTSDNAGGFIDLHYDTTPSPLGKDRTRDDTVTDLANDNTAVNPMLRTDAALTRASIPGSSSLASAIGTSTLLATGSINNTGGFSIPSFGSLVQGTTNRTSLSQQLQAAGTGILNRSASTLANGVVGGVAAGLGKNGTAIVGLAAAAIANPSAALKTVENMATQYAISYASNYINTAVSNFAGDMSKTIAGAVSENIAKPLGEAWSNFTYNVGGGAAAQASAQQMADAQYAADIDAGVYDNLTPADFGDF